MKGNAEEAGEDIRDEEGVERRGKGGGAVINRQSSARAKWTFRPFPLGQGEWQVGGG